MSLLESIISKSVGSAMVANEALAWMNSTTLTKAGTSLMTIQTNAIEAAGSHANASKLTALFEPIQRMKAYALEHSPSVRYQAAIHNAALDASNRVEASFLTALPGLDFTPIDIQNATGQALADGITWFGTNLEAIDPELANEALTIGNTSLPSARESSDLLYKEAYACANQSIAEQIALANVNLISEVQAQNAAVSAASGSSFSSSVTWSGSEGTGTGSSDNNTDTIYQNIKVYIEGVQVPFEAISISQNIGALPSAVVQVPPQAGLMDIVRYYQPKVHIFYTDNSFGGDRLLFWGHIVACNYAKSRQQGMATISFRCAHKNALMNQVTLEWSDLVANTIGNGGDPNSQQAVAQPTFFNSKLTMIAALKGVTGMQTDTNDLISPSNTNIANADVTKVDQRWAATYNRLVGMPGATMNLWNQLKQTCYMNPNLNAILSKIYIPLVEQGLGFFDRLSGHYYLENTIQNSKQPACTDQSSPPNVRNMMAMIPPAFRLPSITAISSTLAVQALSNQLNFSGEMASFAQLFTDFYLSVEYEMITLASPAEVPADPTVSVNPDDPSSSSSTPMVAVETIVKPQIPFYFSPKCNVLFPKMYHSISIEQNEEVIPTRITAFHDLPAVNSSQNGLPPLGTNYRAPASIREAIAIGFSQISPQIQSQLQSQDGQGGTTSKVGNLRDTTGPSFNIPGKYEQGRGVLHHKVAMPQWLAMLTQGQYSKTTNDTTQEAWPAQGTAEYTALLNLYAAWVDRYGYDIFEQDGTITKTRNPAKDALNPYSTQAGIQPNERLLFAAADYEYTKQVAESRTGMIDAVFNPYIVPGYPMDVLADSPNDPTFHGLCVSVTHSISSRSIGTSIGMAAASTYSELSNYYIPPLHPWLQTALNLITVTWDSTSSSSSNSQSATTGSGAPLAFDSSSSTSSTPPTSDQQEYGDVSAAISVQATLINNPSARAAADQFYQSVFGIGAAAPDDIYDFSNGQAIPIVRSAGIWGIGSSSPRILANGGDANDYNTVVGNLRLIARPIEGRAAIESKFGVKFIDLTPQNYSPTGASYQNPLLNQDILLEPGASLFLDYDETDTFVTPTSQTTK